MERAGNREREREPKEFSKRGPFALHIDEIDDDDTCTIAVHTKCNKVRQSLLPVHW